MKGEIIYHRTVCEIADKSNIQLLIKD